MSFWKRFKPNRDCNDEAQQAEMLEAYTRWLKGERLSRKHKNALKACEESPELEPLRQLADYAHHRFEEADSIEPRPGAKERIFNAVLGSVNQSSPEPDGLGLNDIGLEPVYSPEQVGSESELVYPPTAAVESILSGVDGSIGNVGGMEPEGGEASELPPSVDGNCRLNLKVIQGDQVGREYELVFVQMIIGREAGSAIHLKDNFSASRRHAILSIENEEVYVTDLNSRNGTRVDGQLILKPTPIYLASRITIGDQTLEVSKLQREDGAFHVICKEVAGTNVGHSHTVTIGEMSVGRGSAASLRFPDSTRMLSRRHAEFEFTDGQIFLRDLGSTNGTYVDDCRIEEPTRIDKGSVIKFGAITFEVTAIKHA